MTIRASYCSVAFEALMAFFRATKADQTTSTLVLSMSEFLALEAPCWVGDESIYPHPVRTNVDVVWYCSCIKG